MRGPLLTSALLFALLFALLMPALRAQQPGWGAATDLYLAGRAEEALDMIASLPRNQVRNGAREMFEKGNVRERRRAQALLALWSEVHLEIHQGFFEDPRKGHDPWWPRLVCRWAGPVVVQGGSPLNGRPVLSNPKGTLIQIVQWSRKPTTEFLEAWYVLVLANWSDNYFQRDDCLGFAPAEVKRSPEMLLAVGRHQENKWFFARETDYPLRVIANLKEAKQALQKALELEPGLDEARLRLGRVTSLMGDDDEALKMLDTVRAPMAPKFVYLARLFEAEICERRGNLARAEAAYERALGAYPGGQSARVALARVTFMLGRRSQAKASLLEWAREPSAPPQRDPWAEDYYGFEGQLERDRQRLRAMAMK